MLDCSLSSYMYSQFQHSHRGTDAQQDGPREPWGSRALLPGLTASCHVPKGAVRLDRYTGHLATCRVGDLVWPQGGVQIQGIGHELTTHCHNPKDRTH